MRWACCRGKSHAWMTRPSRDSNRAWQRPALAERCSPIYMAGSVPIRFLFRPCFSESARRWITRLRRCRSGVRYGGCWGRICSPDCWASLNPVRDGTRRAAATRPTESPPAFTSSPLSSATSRAPTTTSAFGAGSTGSADNLTATRLPRRWAISGRPKTTDHAGYRNSPAHLGRHQQHDRIPSFGSAFSVPAGGRVAGRRAVERCRRTDTLLLRHSRRGLGRVSATRRDPRSAGHPHHSSRALGRRDRATASAASRPPPRSSDWWTRKLARMRAVRPGASFRGRWHRRALSGAPPGQCARLESRWRCQARPSARWHGLRAIRLPSGPCRVGCSHRGTAR